MVVESRFHRELQLHALMSADQNHAYRNSNKAENATLYENHKLTSKLNR